MKDIKSKIVNYLKKKGTYKSGDELHYSPKELKMGIREEMEHADDRDIAMQIALDHLEEDPKYYTKLKTAKLAKSKKGVPMANRKILLVVYPEQLSKALSNPNIQIKSKTPYTGHDERMAEAKKAAMEMLGAGKPVTAKELTGNPTVSGKGRVAGQKSPYSGYSTGVSGERSDAANNYGKTTYVVKPSEMAAGVPESTKAHLPKNIRTPKS